MKIKNPFQSTATNVKAMDNNYMPSSLEKKRAIMMYLFFGIMVSIAKKDISIFEHYHLKQASGRWIVFFLVLVFDMVLLFLPIIKYLWVIPLLILLTVWIISVKQAWDGKYFTNSKESFVANFSALWSWFIELFEIPSPSKPHNLPTTSDIESDIQNQTNKSEIEKDLEKK